MRLARHLHAIEIEHNESDERPVNDMYSLFGGLISRNPIPNRFKAQPPHFLSSDRQIEAGVAKEVNRFAEQTEVVKTVVRIKNTDTFLNAQRWTAIRAYAAKGGVALSTLVTEVPGSLPYKEWEARHTIEQKNEIPQVQAGLEANVKRAFAFSPASEEYRQLTYNLYTNKYFEELDARQQRRVAGPEFFAGTAGFPDTHTYLYAQGPDLPSMARTMIKGYGELLSRNADEDSEIAVVSALGAVNLNHLTSAWEGAMAQDTPYEAGRFMLHRLGGLYTDYLPD